MKRQHLAIIFCFLWSAVIVITPTCYARERIKGQITDAIGERIGLSTGDEVAISLGKSQGLIKGDIGEIMSKADSQIQLGKCVIQESKDNSATCQIIQSTREIGRGDIVLFDGVDYRDKALFVPLIDLLDSSVSSYPAHEKIRILVHEVFDTRNNVTQFSEKVRGEVIHIASQKKRIIPVASRDFPDFIYYPADYASSSGQVKGFLKKNGFNMILTGTHMNNGSKYKLSFQRICQTVNDGVLAFSLTGDVANGKAMDGIVLPYVKREKRPDTICSVVYKPRQYVPLKEEKNAIIKEEASADPFKELSLKRIAFNIISPVDFSVTIDGAPLGISDSGIGEIALSAGSHRIRATFKRGYFSNESLLYTSTREHSRDVLLELNKDQEVVVEVAAEPIPEKGDHIVFKVYRKVERERHALKPIQRMEYERLIEAFVE